jgi:TonB-linked SusC/RagA family outer membrane protein
MAQKRVSGTVTDSAGETVIGANVVEKGTTNGISTDADGKFALTIKNNATLQISFVGYVTQEINVGNQTSFNIILQEDAQTLEEVVVVGYGTQTKVTVTGAISQVGGERLRIAPVTNFSNLLAGELSGLVAVNTTGEPGNDNPTIRIRGSNTFGDNSALIVIDGVVDRSMSNLDPVDIESISLLKDASAAIYGARAANGVILITTKRGANMKPKLSVNLNYALSQPTIIPKMANSATYATMINEINQYAGRSPQYTEEEIQKFRDGSDPWRYPDTDWFAEVFKPTAPQSNNNISLRGGNENLRYFVSLGYKYQDAIYKNSSAKYSQFNFRSNIDGRITKNINLSLDLAGDQEDRNFAGNPFDYLINRSKPTLVAYYPGGKPATGYQAGSHPGISASDALGYDQRRNYRFMSNVKLAIDIPHIKGLSLVGNVSADKNLYYRKLWRTPYMLYSWDGVTVDEQKNPVVTGALDGPYSSPELTQNTSEGEQLTLNALANFERSFAESHHVKIMVGLEKISGGTASFSAFRRGFLTDAIDQLFAGSELNKENDGSASLSRRLNYFSRINYNYRHRYLLELVGRYDGSYIFPEKGRYGFFPGVSAGWMVSEEGFWKNSLPVINYFKIRASWGQTGNDRIDAYQYLSSYGYGSGSFIINEDEQVKTLYELRIANPDITWEVANQSNVGFDSYFFDNKVSFSFEYFYNFRDNILAYRNASIPASTGLSLPRENIGKMENRGIEIGAGFNDEIQDFTFEINGNLTYAKNKIVFWDEAPGSLDYQQSTGKPLNAGLYYNAIGIFKDEAAVNAYPHWNGARPGDIIFEDYNQDGEINGLDLVRYDKSDQPTLTGGLNINVTYKQFYLSTLLQGAAGAVRTYTLESGLQGDFLEDDANGRWTVDNPNASKPRTWNTGGEYWTSGVSGGTAGINNTYWLKNNDYLRLKSLQIGYNIPKNVCRKLGISALSIYLSGSNLLTFTPLKSFDPETVGNVYPLSKVYNSGINLTF